MFRQNGTHLRVEFHLDRTSPISLDRQIAQTVREAVQKGLLQPGDRIVPIRLLAKHLGVARATVDSAFAILIAEGYLETSRGRGSFISTKLPLQTNFDVVSCNLPNIILTIPTIILCRMEHCTPLLNPAFAKNATKR